MPNQNVKKLVVSAMLAAMTCIATMIIKIPTPTFGYIHLGDGFVLLCGILLGPYTGALAAGIGSMLSDVFSGYVSWAPATLIIKALTAGIAGFVYLRLKPVFHTLRTRCIGAALCGIAGEAVMVLGYFLYEVLLAAFGSGAFTKAALAAGIASSAAGIPFNIVQGIAGILICVLLLPVLHQITGSRSGTKDTAD